MTDTAPGPGDTHTRDEELLADVFDSLLQQILEGETPDLKQCLPDRPDLQDRVAKAWSLACSVAGRREPSRPVLGGYEILRELGHGGMGTVYLARHQALQREVAIKVLPHSLAMSPRAKQRFLEEARSLARLRHEHVVHIHRIIDHAEMLAFEMEFVAGKSLQQVLLELQKQPKPHSAEALTTVLGLSLVHLGVRSSVEWFVRVGIRMARALGEVHRHGLVHRDVKPSNILLRADGAPVLADFGLARDEDPDGKGGAGFAGTPIYAAPERLRGGDAAVDARADVYSLGVTLYEALSLSPPFAGSTTHEVLRRIESGRLPALRRQAPHVSADLETVLAKAMELDPRHRYASADAFADDLERLLSLQPIQARPAGPLRRAVKFVRRNHRMVLSAVCGALLVAAVAWPMVAQAGAREVAKAAAARQLQVARGQLLALDSLQAVSQRTFAGTSRQSLRRPSAEAAQVRSLAAARAGFAAAVAVWSEAADARREGEVVELALAVLAARSAAEPGRPCAAGAGLPDRVRRLAAELATGRASEGLRRELAAAPAAERFAGGLLAFLLGDLATSHSCWRELDQELPEHDLLEACLGLQSASDGFSERAYLRLFHASRRFPGVPTVALALADAALAMGDVALARSWLQALPEDGSEGVTLARRQLLAADLLAAAGDRHGAARGYRELLRADPTDPEPALRLATLLGEDGDREASHRLLAALLARLPYHAGARLELARQALVRRDLPAYLEQVRYVLAQDLHDLPRGTAGLLAEILRLGGLQHLQSGAEFAEPLRLGSFRAGSALPLLGWLPKHVVAAVGPVVQAAAEFDRCRELVSAADMRTFALDVQGGWLTGLRLPGLAAQLPLWARGVVAFAPPLVGGYAADLLAQRAMPYLRALGDPMRVIDGGTRFTWPAGELLHAFAIHLVCADDCDGDTLPDLCIASPGNPGSLPAATVEIRSLHDGGLVRTLRPDNEDLMFGRAIAVLGDQDGDLCSDVLVGAPRARTDSGNWGEVQLRSGRTGERLWRVQRDFPAFGVALARCGDLDGDGRDDFAVGASPIVLQGGELGRAYLLSSADGRELREFVAPRSGTWFGAVVANVGDLDGDGAQDVAIGGNYGRAPGLVVVVSARTGATLLTFADDDEAADYGATVVGLGDVDGDGVPDLAIGAPGFSSRGKQAGRVQVIGGRTGKVLYELFGERPGEGFGQALCAVRDWVGPSGPSLAVAARRGGPVGIGYVRIFAARHGDPQQTFSTGPGAVAVGHALAAVPRGEGERYPALLVPAISRDGSHRLWPVSFAMVAKAGPKR